MSGPGGFGAILMLSAEDPVEDSRNPSALPETFSGGNQKQLP